MAQNQITTADISESSTAKFLFYVKGSKDYPLNQVVSDPFGYDNDSSDGVSTQTAVFETSIRDVLLRSTNPKQIDNLYSLYSDTTNGIPPRISKDGINIRNNRSQEYISSIIVDNGKVISSSTGTSATKFVDHIDPNYDPTVYTLSYIKAHKSDTSVNDSDNMYPLEHIFWQKIYTICEFIKKYEKEIINMYADSSILYPSFFSSKDATTLNDYYGSAETVNNLKLELQNESEIGRFISLFIGKCTDTTKHFETTYESGSKLLYSDKMRYNPYRWAEVTGSDTYSHVMTDDEFGDYTVDEEQEMFWNSSCLNMQYVYGTATMTPSTHENRISKFTFEVKASYSDTISKTWLISCYLDPDGFVNSSSVSKYAVYTYNDDMDDVSKDSNYGIYDNDYANVASSSASLKNNFVTNSTEFENNIIGAIANIMKDGTYKYYQIFETQRVTPTAVDSSGNKSKTVVWDATNHSIMQRFYIFYGSSSAAPSTSQQISCVKEYIKNLHTSGKCHPTTYDSDGYVKTIGHSDSELDQFLSNMYPDLFTSTEVYITPSNAVISTNESMKYDPDNYYATIDLETAYNRIHALNGIFNMFEYSTTGAPTLVSTSSTQKNLPIEFINIGGIKDSEITTEKLQFKYPMPLICTSFGTSNARPLTNLSGFANYRPSLYTYDSGDTGSFSYSDKLQLILIKLFDRMFTQGSSKTYYTSICGVPISYSVDINADSDLDITRLRSNVAKFTINNVNFIVISLKGTVFRDSSGTGTAA